MESKIVRQDIKARAINYIEITIVTETGCNARDGEFSLYLSGFIGCLDLNSYGGVDDISLIKDCIENNIDWEALPEEGMTEIILRESGEWEDVFWHKYYEIERFTVLY